MAAANSNISKALETLVHKRQQQIAYLRRTHQPDVDFNDVQNFGQSSFWLNTINVSPVIINTEMQNEQRKLNGWFCLGTSLSKLLDIEDHLILVNSFIQLMEEFSYQFGQRMHASFSYLRSKNLQDKFDINANQPIKPIIWKRDNKVVFQLLDTPRLPEQLNYCLVVYSMLSILYLLYSRFLHPQCSNETWRKAIENLDEKVSTLVLKDLTDVLTKLTSDLVEKQINDVMPRNGDNIDANNL
mmetsp:Transcript_54627/g.87320  ORF Transcript_54627/g.87320 Transcript_54627/m.87320 type:complete len:242 (-) Transcript_54627:55-780(-)